MKILFGYLSGAYRGGTKYQMDFAGAMENAQVGFITSNSRLPYEDQAAAIGPIHRIPPTRKFFQRLNALKALAKEYDILYLNKATLNPFELIMAKAAGFQKVVYHSHATGKDVSNPVVRLVFDGMHLLSLPFVGVVADKLYACSVPAAQWLYGKKNGAKATVIRNGIDLTPYTFSPELREKTRKELALHGPCIIHVGAFSAVKNQSYLVRGFQVFHQRHPDSTLLLVGEGELLGRVRQEAASLGLEGCVRFLGQRNDVPALMQAADLLVLPSLREGLPFVAVEAQAAGLPCLITDTAASECRITDLCSLFSISMPPEALCQAMESQITLPRRNTRQEIAQAGYDLTVCARELERQLQQLLCEPQSSSNGK